MCNFYIDVVRLSVFKCIMQVTPLNTNIYVNNKKCSLQYFWLHWNEKMAIKHTSATSLYDQIELSYYIQGNYCIVEIK